jgi:RND family efflux transporter MFP subunit
MPESSPNTLAELRIDRTSPRPSRPKGPWIIGGILFLAAVLAVLWWFMRPKPIEVRTATVRDISTGGSGTGRTVLNAAGYVTARRQATVSSKITGKVVEVLVEEGKRVEAGQVLARVDDTNIKASLRLAEAQRDAAKSALAETRVRLAEAELQLKRTAGLAKSNIATQADLDHDEAEAKSFQARLERQQVEITVAERELAVWQQQLEDTVIRAPFSGIVTIKNAQPGEMISPMSAGGSFTRTGICTIVDMQSLEIEIDVNESFINRVEPGQPVEAKLDAYQDWTIPCRVIAIIPTADRQKATVKVRVGFDKLDPRILPEMAAKVAFRGAEASGATASASASVLVVPRAAVQAQDGRDVAFVVRDGRAERRAVNVSSRRDEEVVIAAGLTAGERVVISPAPSLTDGMPVKEAKP